MPLSPLPAVLAFAALAACSGAPEPEAEREPVETVFDDMVGAPQRAEDRLDAAREGHREALERALEASEGDSPAGE